MRRVKHPGLGCFVEKLEYDFLKHTGALYAFGYCDMSACIEFFEGIDPDVRLIQTFVEGEWDTRYSLDPAGEWVAHIVHKRGA
jgi:hypothetical protein